MRIWHGSLLQANPTYTNAQGLVSPAWLEAHLDDPDLAILDIRGEVAKDLVQSDGSQVHEVTRAFCLA